MNGAKWEIYFEKMSTTELTNQINVLEQLETTIITEFEGLDTIICIAKSVLKYKLKED